MESATGHTSTIDGFVRFLERLFHFNFFEKSTIPKTLCLAPYPTYFFVTNRMQQSSRRYLQRFKRCSENVLDNGEPCDQAQIQILPDDERSLWIHACFNCKRLNQVGTREQCSLFADELVRTRKLFMDVSTLQPTHQRGRGIQEQTVELCRKVW